MQLVDACLTDANDKLLRGEPETKGGGEAVPIGANCGAAGGDWLLAVGSGGGSESTGGGGVPLHRLGIYCS